MAAIVVRYRMIEHVAWEGAMAAAEVWMVGSWAVCWARALAQEMLMVVGYMIVGERRHMTAWHSWMAASV